MDACVSRGGSVTASSRKKEAGMSKKSNVHPGHYQTEGRSRPGDDLLQDFATQEYAQSQQELAKRASPKARKAKSRGASRTRRTAGVPTPS